MRIWCGGGDSKDASESLYAEAADKALHLSERAEGRGISVSFEFHRGGLTDNVESTLKLLKLTKTDNIRTYFQVYPREETTPEQELIEIMPVLTNIHCYHWDGNERLMLSEGRDQWESILNTAVSNGFTGWVLLEFTKDDSDENFMSDAEVLCSIADQVS